MKIKDINKILADTAYVRFGGSDEERRCAEYIKDKCAEMGLEAHIEPFLVPIYEEHEARLLVNGKEIACKGYFGVRNATVCAEIHYLEDTSRTSLRKCRGKIVLTDKPMSCSLHQMLGENGAVGFITSTGNINFSDRDIDRREIGFETGGEPALPGVNIHIADTVEIVKSKKPIAEIRTNQSVHLGNSYNVILEIKGECDETVNVCAHYDSTSLSVGAYDNMSGTIALLGLAEHFCKNPHKKALKLLWCGSEERGLLGSYEYCRTHKDDVSKTTLNINLDMLGSIMGGFIAFSCADEEMTEYLEKFISKHNLSATTRYGIRSSDSNSFIAHGVPSVSFARSATEKAAIIHTRYDTAEVISAKNLIKDIDTVRKFTELALNSLDFPQARISDKIKEDVEKYFKNKKILKES